MRRICCFCETWASGGIESFLSKLFACIDRNEFEIDLVVAQRRDSVFNDVPEKYGVSIIELSGSKSRYFANYFQLKKILKENRYDVLHLNAFQGLQLIYLHAAKKTGVPVRIAHSHNTDIRKKLLRFAQLWVHKAAKKLFSRFATSFWACSESAAKFLFSSKQLREKGFQWIPNGIDTRQFQFDSAVRARVRGELGTADDDFVIGNVGRLCDQKNQAFLLDVLAEAIKIQPRCRLLLVGEGEHEEMLQEKAERLGILDKVIFYGTTTKPQELLWAMDAFAFPSLFEGLGIAAVEAQSTGLRTVCSEHIPGEADLTAAFCRVPLERGAGEWARSLLQAECAEREKYSELVRSAGCDMAQAAEKVSCGYMKN